MGLMNLLKANYTGKVGQTVGSKWKNKSTLRTLTAPSNPDTEDQRHIRGNFSILTKFVALFADMIKYKTALDTSGMSVKNAIIKINKDLINAQAVNLADLVISKGGLQTPNTVAATYTSASGEVAVTWIKPTATNFTSDAKLIVVFVNGDDKVAGVGEFPYDAQSGNFTVGAGLTGTNNCYAYYLDRRGSAKIGSQSVSVTVA